MPIFCLNFSYVWKDLFFSLFFPSQAQQCVHTCIRLADTDHVNTVQCMYTVIIYKAPRYFNTLHYPERVVKHLCKYVMVSTLCVKEMYSGFVHNHTSVCVCVCVFFVCVFVCVFFFFLIKTVQCCLQNKMVLVIFFFSYKRHSASVAQDWAAKVFGQLQTGLGTHITLWF
jgi:hypothetical protein